MPIYCNDLALHLKFNGTNGQLTTVDSSTNNHTVTNGGGALLDTATKKFGTASSQGAGGALDLWRIAAHSSLNLGTAFTLEGWVNPGSSAAARVIASQFQNGAANSSFYFYLNGSTPSFLYVQGGVPTEVGFGTTITTNGSIFTHLAVVRYSGNLLYFINGTLVLTTPITGSIDVSTRDWNIGGYADGTQANQTLIGRIDEFRYWNRALYTTSFTVETDELTCTANPSSGAVDGTVFCPFVTQGQVRKMVTSITGLSHLNTEEVSVQADGIPDTSQTYTVSGGAITLSEKAAVVHVGLPYRGTIKLLKPNEGSQKGTGQMKMRRIYRAGLRVFRSLGFKIGLDEDNLDPVILGDPTLPLVSADLKKVPKTKWDLASQLYIIQDLPSPVFLLAIILESEVEEY